MRVVTASVSEDNPKKKGSRIGNRILVGKEGPEIKISNINYKKHNRMTVWLAIVTSFIIISVSAYKIHSTVVSAIMPESKHVN
ncbi:MAG: hypothetical protein APF77_02375 [Clostridia bacterium BRH_c25]|nr:MAG: hypothetical protein APF77_02375 [Clostridia bacterium BRH_c25]